VCHPLRGEPIDLASSAINPDEDWVVVNPLSEMVKELAGFELEDGLEPADPAE
jgi:hypothetical protein